MAENLIEEEEFMLSDDAVAVINKDLVSFMETLKDMIGQLEPQVKALTKELSPKLNVIKANLDKDETFVLAERLSGNTGMLLEMLSLLEGLDDLRRQLEPQLKALVHEVGPQMNAIKANLDRDETLVLLERLSANTGTLLELIGYLEAFKDMASQFEPQLKGLAHELSPRINAIKTNLDRDETFLLIERLTANTGTVLELVTYLEAMTDLKNQIEPQLKAMMKEMSPAVTSIRTFIENERTIEFAKRGFNVVQGFVEDDEVLNLVERMPNLKAPFMKFMDCMCTRVGGCEDGPTVAESSIESLLKLTEIASTPVVQNLVATTAGALQEAGEAQIKPVSPMGMLSMLRDKDVQRATGFLFYFLKKLGQGLNAAPSAAPPSPAPPASPES
ncbi:MAG: helical membrane plugin domain-containing protein [Candidatus Aquicultor sp.]